MAENCVVCLELVGEGFEFTGCCSVGCKRYAPRSRPVQRLEEQGETDIVLENLEEVSDGKC